MAEDRTLELLAQVVDGLRGLGEQSPGAPLKAADWNRLVAAVTDLAGIIVARAEADRARLYRDFAPVDHDHVGQVLLSWLDGPTRALIERSANGSVEQSVATERLATRLGALDGRVEALTGGVDQLKAGVDGVLDQDMVRGRQIERVQRDVEAAQGLETRIGQVAANLEGFDQARRDLLAFRDSLRDAAGQPIDLAALRDGLGQVEDLRQRLTLGSGELASLRDLERKISRLEGRDTRSANEVKKLIAEQLADPGSGVANAVEGRVREGLTPRLDEMDARIGAFDPRAADTDRSLAELRNTMGGIDARIGTLDGRVEGIAAVGAQAGALAERVTAVEGLAQAARADAAAAANLPGRLDALDGRVGELGQRLSGDLGRFEVQLETARAATRELATRLDANGDLGGRLRGLAERLDALTTVDAQMGELRTRIGQQEELLNGARAQMAGLADQTAAISRLEAGMGALQASRAAADRDLQDLRRQQGVLEGRIGRQPIDVVVGPGDVLRPVNR